MLRNLAGSLNFTPVTFSTVRNNSEAVVYPATTSRCARRRRRGPRRRRRWIASSPIGQQGRRGGDPAWFDGYASDIGYEVRDLHVTVDGDVGFCSFLYHVTGTLKTGDEVDMWVRATLGCQQINGTWLIVHIHDHDHESVPFDAATGKALINLTP